MSESAVDEVDRPVTPTRIASDLRALGLGAGDTVIVHSSLSALGWVAGGAPSVVDALRTVLTDDGTLVMPTHTPDISEPSYWQAPSVPDGWYDIIRSEMAPFRPAVTPCPRVGAIPDCFRSYPDAVRSEHPTMSFAAWGVDAEAVVADHSIDYGLGEDSPLAAVYDRDGRILLLGVGHEVNTSLHLAEHRANWERPAEGGGAPMLVGGDGEAEPTREWVTFEELATSTDDFPACGAAFEDAKPDVTTGTVGLADATLLDQRALVDFATEWFGATRN